ncbi:MAG: cyclic nucleotide-binding and patatin-like phospholipase domain-containing protein [Legionellaceae bacterium]|nr:cyclic nucleotide-binding and patatin-like phospholipase domain-containing protein [Legionellaceae bacterium]
MAKSTLGITKEQMVTFLSKIDLFSNLSLDVIREISDGFELTYLAGNSVLIQQNDTSDCMYVLMFGFLRAIKIDSDGTEKVIGELSAGSIVGEIGCLFDEPRTASVYTIRDSVLLKMTRAAFNVLLEKHPRIMMGIVRQSVKRLVNPEKYSPKRDVSCFCLIPAGTYTEIEKFSHIFVEKLSKYGETLLLTQDIIDKIHGGHLVESSLESANTLSLFQELESKYRFLVYVAADKNAWARRCIGQTDKILLIGQYGEDPALGEVEHFLFDKKNEITPAVELILLFGENAQNPTETNQWFKHRDLSSHHKVRQPYTKDLERVVRLITGNALGLVLSGGGSCALSHVGVIRALDEANIPVDYIAGTSMGAIIGGLFAREIDHQTLTEMLVYELEKFQNGLDYTLPIVALIKAKLLDHLLRSSLGEKTKIEDLWQKYFCVSTNISTNELRVHEEGLLWQAVRASISLPGILPAVFDAHQQIFVDGGILNNLPVDSMASRIQGGKILASSIVRRNDSPSTLSYEEYTSSGWRLLFKYFLWPKLTRNQEDKKKNFVTIASIIQDSMIVGSNNHQEAMIKQADYNIIMDLNQFNMVSFSTIQAIIDSGYQQATQALASMHLSDDSH